MVGSKFILALAFVGATTLLLGEPVELRAQDDDHSHGHNESNLRMHGHGGFPGWVDVFFTHHAYLEKKIRPRFDTIIADETTVNALSAELVWEFTNWFGAEVNVPFVWTSPQLGEGETGFGDIEVAPMFAFVRDPEKLLIMTARSGFGLPTGSEEKGLGGEGWTWEPGFLVWKGYGADRRGALQGEFTYERLYATEVGFDEEELVYNLAWSHWLSSNWIPIAEFNGVTRLGEVAHSEDDEHADGEEEGEHHEEGAELLAPFRAGRGLVLASGGGGIESEERTQASATFGFRYAFANAQQWGAGVQLPLNGRDAFNVRLVFGGIIHFF